MRSTIVPLSVLLLSGCAGLPVDFKLGAGPDPLAAREPPADPLPIVTAAHTAPPRDCKMIRAIDGRAVCAPPAREVAPMAARPRPVALVADKPASLTSRVGDSAPSGQAPGAYLVIGSFRARDNADRWAHFNAEFGTAVYTTHRDGQPVYRVLVGPLDDGDSTGILRDILEAIGVGGSWRLSICGRSSIPGTCGDIDEANLGVIAGR